MAVMPEHATVLDVSRYYPASERRADLVEAMRRLASSAAKSPGCFGAQVCTSDRDGDALVAVSRWESQAALDAFAADSEFVEQRESLAALLGRPATREHLLSV